MPTSTKTLPRESGLGNVAWIVKSSKPQNCCSIPPRANDTASVTGFAMVFWYFLVSLCVTLYLGLCYWSYFLRVCNTPQNPRLDLENGDLCLLNSYHSPFEWIKANSWQTPWRACRMQIHQCHCRPQPRSASWSWGALSQRFTALHVKWTQGQTAGKEWRNQCWLVVQDSGW